MPHSITQSKPASKLSDRYRGIFGLERRITEIIDGYSSFHKKKLLTQGAPDKKKKYDNRVSLFKELLKRISEIDTTKDLSQYNKDFVQVC